MTPNTGYVMEQGLILYMYASINSPQQYNGGWVLNYSTCALVSASNEFVSLAEMEDALQKNLFQGYQRWVRPIQRANDTIRVRFGLKISQLVDVVRMNIHIHLFSISLNGNLRETEIPLELKIKLDVRSRWAAVCRGVPALKPNIRLAAAQTGAFHGPEIDQARSCHIYNHPASLAPSPEWPFNISAACCESLRWFRCSKGENGVLKEKPLFLAWNINPASDLTLHPHHTRCLKATEDELNKAPSWLRREEWVTVWWCFCSVLEWNSQPDALGYVRPPSVSGMQRVLVLDYGSTLLCVITKTSNRVRQPRPGVDTSMHVLLRRYFCLCL